VSQSPLREPQMQQGSYLAVAAHTVRQIVPSCRVVPLWRRLSIASLRYFVSRIFLWKTLYAWRILYASYVYLLVIAMKWVYNMSSTRPADVRKLRMQWTHSKAVLADCVFRNRTHAVALLVRGIRFLQRWILLSGMWHLVSRYAVTIVFAEPVNSAVQFSRWAPPCMIATRHCFYGSWGEQPERVLTNLHRSHSGRFLPIPLGQKSPDFTWWRTHSSAKITAILY
jgi:hypothetical protein